MTIFYWSSISTELLLVLKHPFEFRLGVNKFHVTLDTTRKRCFEVTVRTGERFFTRVFPNVTKHEWFKGETGPTIFAYIILRWSVWKVWALNIGRGAPMRGSQEVWWYARLQRNKSTFIHAFCDSQINHLCQLLISNIKTNIISSGYISPNKTQLWINSFHSYK